MSNQHPVYSLESERSSTKSSKLSLHVKIIKTTHFQTSGGHQLLTWLVKLEDYLGRAPISYVAHSVA